MHNTKLINTANKLKKRIIEIEAGNDDLSEMGVPVGSPVRWEQVCALQLARRHLVR